MQNKTRSVNKAREVNKNKLAMTYNEINTNRNIREFSTRNFRNNEIKQKNSTGKNRKSQVDFILIVLIIILLLFGIVMVLSASAPSALAEGNDAYTYVTRQIQFAILGLAIMWFVSKIDYRIYRKFYWPIYWISIGVLLLVLIPGLGVESGGASRWINLGFTQFQPSEITKIGLIIFYAGYLTDHKADLRSFKKGFVIPLLYLIPPVAIALFIQNHLSVGIIMSAITFVMMLMAGCRLLYFVLSGLIVGGGGITALAIYLNTAGASAGDDSFRLGRILNFMDPWQDPTGKGWQTIQSLYAIGSGGLFGVGLGESRQKYLYVSEPQNDFIFSILAEELGFVGCVVVIILFALFIWRGIIIAMKAKDMFGSLLATGITSLVMIQTVLNIGVVTNSIPNTGISLPFFSAGGTALIMLLGMCGILLNISRTKSKV